MEDDDIMMISLHRFRESMGIIPSTAWRWIKRGWLDEPINIGGRQYLTKEMIQRFKERASRAEFAIPIKPPSKRKSTR